MVKYEWRYTIIVHKKNTIQTKKKLRPLSIQPTFAVNVKLNY